MGAIATIGPSALTRDLLHPLAVVEQVFIEQVGNKLNITAVMNEKDPAAMDRLFKAEAEIIDAFPDLQLSFDVILRLDRPLRELIVPKGTSLFSR